MSDDKKRNFQERMAALNEKYRQQLPDKIKAIEDSWKDYQSDLSNPDYLELFYRLIHTLKGTAATFGYVTQADFCFAVQQLLTESKKNQSILDQASIPKIQEQLNALKANISAPAEKISD